ncbi:hypothetical protein TOPH_07047 [Tolypocladium ophioglossoides CBS 100239]|uniref:Rhodopsin domain-containing protein n=1 Tax=Tolypocladium ophioglossoides (strain CBS 100239) TaxID=1163406 RepID=A0A0L0N357_TOLOC|nr:hypothetical protein TOPH_07047 [Tolypocladium ophioglossoides CBS 100239]
MWHIAGVAVGEANYGLIVSTFLFTSLACLAVLLRVVTRAFLVRNLGLDDWFMVAAFLGSVAYLSTIVEQIRYGQGEHVSLASVKNFLQWIFITVNTYIITQLTVKFSILLQCRRIFTDTSAQRLFLGLLIWLTFYGLFSLFSTIFGCVPVAKFWDVTLPGRCLDHYKLQYALAAINIVNDIALLVAPMLYLKNLHIRRRAKIVLIAVFTCGAFPKLAIWSGLEINIAIICASVPGIKPLFVHFFPRMLNTLPDSAKPSHGTTHGALPLHSSRSRVDGGGNAQHDGHSETNANAIAIQVHQSFEMKTMAADDDSEKNLVTADGSAQTAECYYSGSRSTINSHQRLA